VPKEDKFNDYTRYAELCLNMVAGTTDQELRRIQREMAAEWLRLADAIRPSLKSWKVRPLKSRQIQMG
jgi:hypothetical protein